MYDNVNRVERDAAGNYWFLSDLFGRRSKCINFSIDEVINPRLRKPTKKSKGKKG